jgi:hypothetical protein
MLTQSDYRPIDQDWDKETILECCKTNDPDQPCNDCCYNSWQDELNKVNPSYNAIVEKTALLQSKLDFIMSRRDRYKAWIDELDKAELLAREICHQLKLIANQSDKIWYNTCKAEEAIQILFCMLRDIFMQIDEMQAIFDSLDNCLRKNNAQGLNKGEGIFKYLEEYRLKLVATVKTRDEVVKNIVLAIRLASLLRNGLSTRDCDSEPAYNPCEEDQEPCATLNGTVHYGMKALICEWYDEFACDTPCSENTSAQTKQSGGPHSHEGPQSDDCDLKPVFDFPVCNNKFKEEVQSWLDKDNADLTDLLDELNKAKMKQQSLLACKNSLDQAIKAVDPAARCK